MIDVRAFKLLGIAAIALLWVFLGIYCAIQVIYGSRDIIYFIGITGAILTLISLYVRGKFLSGVAVLWLLAAFASAVSLFIWETPNRIAMEVFPVAILTAAVLFVVMRSDQLDEEK